MDRCHLLRQLVPVFFIAVVVSSRAVGAQPMRGSASPGYNYEFGGNINTQMKIILGVLIFGMLFIAVFSLYLRKCLDDSAAVGLGSSRFSATTANNRTRKFPSGLDSSVIETFPVFVYADVKKLKSGDHALECAVCISEFSDEETLRLLPKCHHVFHPDCIDAWLASHITCPVCRANLTAPDDKLTGESEYNHELIGIGIGINGERPRSEEESRNQVVIDVEEDRSRPKFPRSHSTGHSLVLPGENCERYTLRLPEEVRKQIETLKRTNSCGCSVVVPRDGSFRRGWRGGGDGGGGSSRGGWRWNQGRSDRWTFTVTPPFIAKNSGVGKCDRAQSSLPSSSTSPPVFGSV